MSTDFIVYEKGPTEEKSITMTIRIDRELRDEYDRLASQSKHSRNELIGMALKYAIDNLKFIPDAPEED